MRTWTTTTGPDRPHPDAAGRALAVDDADTYGLRAAARELAAQVLYERSRRVWEVRVLLADLAERDGSEADQARLDAEAEATADAERVERFLAELAVRLQPDGELLAQAAGLDDHALWVCREAAGSLVDACPASLAHLRPRVVDEQRAELRARAHLLRERIILARELRGLRLLQRCRRSALAEGRAELASCDRRLRTCEARLAALGAKLQVITAAERARDAWIAGGHRALARGVAATRTLAARAERRGDG
jgi:hypothetical protein